MLDAIKAAQELRATANQIRADVNFWAGLLAGLALGLLYRVVCHLLGVA